VLSETSPSALIASWMRRSVRQSQTPPPTMTNGERASGDRSSRETKRRSGAGRSSGGSGEPPPQPASATRTTGASVPRTMRRRG
jgi:hypothetical protein